MDSPARAPTAAGASPRRPRCRGCSPTRPDASALDQAGFLDLDAEAGQPDIALLALGDEHDRGHAQFAQDLRADPDLAPALPAPPGAVVALLGPGLAALVQAVAD